MTVAAISLLANAQVFAEVIDGEELVDPTRPFSIQNVDDDSLVQDLIRTVIPASYDVSFIRAGGSPMAVINQQRVSIGDVIGGAEVLEIDREGVTLLVGAEERRISLYDVSVKTTSLTQ